MLTRAVWPPAYETALQFTWNFLQDHPEAAAGAVHERGRLFAWECELKEVDSTCFLLSNTRFSWKDGVCNLEIFIGFRPNDFPNTKVFSSQNWDGRELLLGCWQLPLVQQSQLSVWECGSDRVQMCWSSDRTHWKSHFLIQRLSVESYPMHYLWLLREKQHWTYKGKNVFLKPFFSCIYNE